MGSPTGVNGSIQQKQRNSLLILSGIEYHICSIAVVASSRIFRLDVYGTVEKLGTRGEIERMEPLMVCRAAFRHRDDVDGAIRASFGIDDGSCGDTDLRFHLVAATRVRCGFSGFQHCGAPQRCPRVGIKGVDGIVCSDGHDQNVVRAFAGYCHARRIERLGIHFPSTESKRILPNVDEATLTGVKTVSVKFWAVLPLSL